MGSKKTMGQRQATGSRGNNHQHVTLRRNSTADQTKETFTQTGGSNQIVILKYQIRSDRKKGPDHQLVVLRRKYGSFLSDIHKQFAEPQDTSNDLVISYPPVLPTILETVDQPLPAEVYIFNHEDFGSERSRKGSSEDVKALRKTFEKLQCKITEIPDPTLSMVKHEVWKLAVKNFDAHSALVVVILSHGQRKEIIETCDQKYYSLDDDVLFPLFGNQSLRGKPKILIVQACKGLMTADASPSENCCDPRDYIKCYSTTEGFLSYRHELEGSVYIQTLCKAMDQDALTKDFRRIIEDVNAKVAEESFKSSYKQVPATTTTFYRRYCFGDYVQTET